MKGPIVGMIAVAVVAGVMAFGWNMYKDFLTQGQKPPESASILTKMENEGVPDVDFTDISGKTYKLSDFKDRILIMNFWASWCEPCVQEFPSLLKLIAHFKGQVVIVAVSADYNMDDLTSFIKAFEAEVPNMIVVWEKDQRLAKKFGTKVLPESYILGKQNKMIRKIAGVDDWYTPDAISYFEELLKQ